jgi:filamentous hemagglutinin family protein
MNAIYRLVWNAGLSCFVVASEMARSCKKGGVTGHKKSAAVLAMGGLFISPWSPVLQAGEVVSSGAATSVHNSANGVPIVDIATANASGLSHNQFTQYNVDAKGLVLNNNSAASGVGAIQSQLAGQVNPNLNLTHSATVILNEVIAANRSILGGYTEVAGSIADVIVANPWGITCIGCGFINTDRVTLTTGVPDINGGVLSGFNVRQGDVLINGSGADLSAQQMFDVVARSVELDGQVNANDVKLVAGSNDWDYDSRTANAIAGTGDVPSYAIDSTMLGGMYAGRIQLISTEAGVGVRMLGDAAASAQDFSITANGMIELHNNISAKTDIALTTESANADAIKLADTSLTAEQNLTLAAITGGATISGGVIKAGSTLTYNLDSLFDTASDTATALADNNKRFANTVDANITGAADIDDVAYGAANTLNINAGGLTLATGSADVYTESGALTLATNGDMVLNDASINAANGLTLLSSNGQISIGAGADQGLQAKSGDVVITTANGLSNAGTISADAGGLTISADNSITNSGTLYGATAIALDDISNTGTEGITNSGAVLSDGTLTVDASSLVNTAEGEIQGSGTTNISATDIDNSGLLIASNTASQVGTIDSDTLTNSGTLQSADDLDLNIQTSLNNSNNILAMNNINVIGSDAATVLVVNNLSSGSIQAITAGSLITITGQGGSANANLTNAGIIVSDQLNIDATDFLNDGVIEGRAGGSDIDVANELTNETGARLLLSNSGGSATVSTSSLINRGALQSDGDLDIDAVSAFSNTGTILSEAGLTIDALNFNNAATGVIQGDGETVLTASDQVVNQGLLVLADASGQFGTILADSLLNMATGVIRSSGSLVLNVFTSLTNNNQLSASENLYIVGGSADTTLSVTNTSDGEILADEGVLTIAGVNGLANVSLDNQGGQLEGGTFNFDVSSLTNSGILRGNTGDSNITVAVTLNNTASGKILLSMGGGSSTIITTNALTNPSVIHSGGDLVVSASDITNESSAGLSALDDLTLIARSGYVRNNGALYAQNQFAAYTTTFFQNNTTGTINAASMLFNGGAFINHNMIEATGNIDVTATSFANEWSYTPAVTGSLISATTSTVSSDIETTCSECNEVWVYEEVLTYRETLVGSLPTQTPQILSGGDIVINYGTSFENTGSGLISAAGNLELTGATFNNETFALYDQEYRRRWNREKYDCFACDDDWYYRWAGTSEQFSSTAPYFSGDDSSLTWGDGGVWDSVGPTTDSNTDNYNTARGNAYLQDFGRTAWFDELNGGLYAGGTLTLNATTVNNSGSATAPTLESISETSDQLAAANAAASRVGGATPVAISGGLTFGGLSLSLPTNPNGYFVPTVDPASDYLIETNPLFAVGSNFGGSNYLAEQFGYDPEQLQKRLGDATYEAYIIRQQLIAETGNNLLAGYQSETDLLQDLMEQGASEATRLEMQWGERPTAEQLANLEQDMVWMVEVTVGGETVLTPQVFLSKATRDNIVSGAVIAGNAIQMDVESFTNTGGAIIANEALDITSKNDIINTSGAIKGGEVSLKSTEGSIVNETYNEGFGDELSYKTVIGKTGSIESTGGLTLDADKDVRITGADVNVEGDTRLKAGNDVVIETIVDKTTTTKAGVLTAATIFNPVTSSETVTTETNIGSNLTLGGKLSIESGNDATIAGSKVDVSGDLEVDTGGDFSVVAVQDKVTTTSESTKSGLGVGGGFVGTETVTTTNYKGTNKGSTLNVGGNATIDSGGMVVLQGSDATIAGDDDIIAAGGIKILDGLDEEHETKVTETTTYLKVGNDKKPDTRERAVPEEPPVNSASNSQYLKADATASEKTEAESEHSVKFVETTTTVNRTGSTSSVGSNLKVGGTLTATTEGTTTIQGSTVDVGGDVALEAKNVDVLTGRNTTYTNTDTRSSSVGLFEESGANASAEAEAGAKAYGPAATNANASAEAEMGANSTVTMGIRTETDSSYESTLTNTSSVIKSGGNMVIKAEETATFVGADVESGGNMAIEATDINNLAAQDTTHKTTSNDAKTVGVYVDGSASAEAEAGASANTWNPSASGNANASAEGEVGAGIRYKTETASTLDSTVTNKGNTFKSGGDFTRTATDTIVDQATDVDAGGDITQSARVIRDEAVHDVAISTSDSTSHDVKAGIYAGAGTEANAEAGAAVAGRVGKGADRTKGGAEASAGFSAKYEGSSSDKSIEKQTAVVSKFTAGGNISSDSEEKTTLVGTQFESGGDVTIEAGSLDYQAAQDTTIESETTNEGSVGGKIAVYGSAGGKLEGEYEGGDKDSTSTEAKTGSINAGGNLTIKTDGDATFVGTKLEAANEASIDAGGDVDFQAAKDTTSSTELTGGAQLSVSATSKDKGMDAGGEIDYSTNDTEEAVVGSIKSGSGGTSIKSGGDTTLVGTKLESRGATSVDAGGDVALKAAESTTDELGVGGSIELMKEEDGPGLYDGGKPEGGISAGFTKADSVKSTTTSIQSDGGITIKGGTITDQEATLDPGEGATNLDGKVSNIKAQDSDSATGVETGYKSDISRK